MSSLYSPFVLSLCSQVENAQISICLELLADKSRSYACIHTFSRTKMKRRNLCRICTLSFIASVLFQRGWRANAEEWVVRFCWGEMHHCVVATELFPVNGWIWPRKACVKKGGSPKLRNCSRDKCTCLVLNHVLVGTSFAPRRLSSFPLAFARPFFLCCVSFCLLSLLVFFLCFPWFSFGSFSFESFSPGCFSWRLQPSRPFPCRLFRETRVGIGLVWVRFTGKIGFFGLPPGSISSICSSCCWASTTAMISHLCIYG